MDDAAEARLTSPRIFLSDGSALMAEARNVTWRRLAVGWFNRSTNMGHEGGEGPPTTIENKLGVLDFDTWRGDVSERI